MNEIHGFVTTANALEGYRIVRHLGVVRGITVRSLSLGNAIGAAFSQLGGGNIVQYTQLAEHARYEAYEIMIRHAVELGANAIVAVRYDATEIAQGATEVLAYGTAVVIEAI